MGVAAGITCLVNYSPKQEQLLGIMIQADDLDRGLLLLTRSIH